MKKIEYLKKIEKLILTKDFQGAEILALEVLPKYEDALIYYFLGICQIELKKTELSIYHLKKSIFLDDKLLILNARFVLGNIYIAIKKFDLAENVLRELIAINDKEEKYLLSFINTLIHQNRSQELKSELGRALDKFPNSKDLNKLKVYL